MGCGWPRRCGEPLLYYIIAVIQTALKILKKTDWMECLLDVQVDVVQLALMNNDAASRAPGGNAHIYVFQIAGLDRLPKKLQLLLEDKVKSP